MQFIVITLHFLCSAFKAVLRIQSIFSQIRTRFPSYMDPDSYFNFLRQKNLYFGSESKLYKMELDIIYSYGVINALVYIMAL